tara:strand:+ start:114 stop:758 length:645 start_codon:yes stop_codon:yes gene_type:complete
VIRGNPDSTNILLGTNNSEKIKELSLLLGGLPLKFESVKDVKTDVPLVESAHTHYENACLKARYWSAASNSLAIASDGGLVIPSMFGIWNSLYTNRTFVDLEVAKRPGALLEFMDRHEGLDRKAFWLEAVAVAVNGVLLSAWVARSITGAIAFQVNERNPRPEFWVNGIWYFPDIGKYYGSLDVGEGRLYPDHWAVLESPIKSFFQSYLGLKPD